MTPAARLSSAIEVLDRILAGDPATLTLTNWARNSRYAGSRDRAAVRDIVYECLRRKRSFSAPFRSAAGRELVLSYALANIPDWPSLFSGQGYDPDVLTKEETAALVAARNWPDPVQLDYPDFLDAELRRSLGDDFFSVMSAMQDRAPVDLRVNTMKCSATEAVNALAAEEILVERVPGVPTALRVTENPRRVSQSRAYLKGWVELQDASSQAVTHFSGAAPGMSVLDYCAGGGGKSLALFDMIRGQGRVVAHDIAAVRMNDLPARATRAGARITIAQPGHKDLAPGAFDLVFVDAPCSGTGSWRRTPDAKWRIREDDLAKLDVIQFEILKKATSFVAPGGVLIYATCSILARENIDRVQSFVAANSSYKIENYVQYSPVTIGDGFFAARIVER